MFTNNTSLISPTRNRPHFVKNLLQKFSDLSVHFFEIIVVDSSDNEHQGLVENICKKFLANYFYTWPSTSHQRNFGIEKKNSSTKYIMFLDDDIIFYDNAIFEMNEIIKKFEYMNDVAAYGFNQIQQENKTFFENIKNSKLCSYLGLYSNKPGVVLQSGWHSKILNLKEDIFADWIFTTVCIYKFDYIKNFRFDETLGRYSYLEDLDFSLNLKLIKKKIFISSRAKFAHPKNIDRSSFDFGLLEVTNRYKIVKKHNLSSFHFSIVSLLRFFISFCGIFSLNKKLLLRSLGNIAGFIKCLKKN
jgi:glycosyltransferase involved in cell wall biosynthesis